MRKSLLGLLLIPALAAILLSRGGGAEPPAASPAGFPLPRDAVTQEMGEEASPVMRCLYYERELFLSAMSAPREYEGQGRLAAGMIPHHLVASDMIAGFFRLAAEDAEGYDTVLFVAPSHFPENCGSDVVTSTWDWQTPYGPVKSDAAVSRALLDNPAVGAEDNPAAIEADHGVAGLIPFVRYYLPDAKVAPCLLSNKLDRRRLAAVWEQVAEICSTGRVLVVASVDCSHYLMPEEAALRDEETALAIEAMDLGRILSFGDANMDSPQSLTTFLEAARAAGGQLRQLDHSSSGEKLPQAISNPVYREGITSYFVYGAFLEKTEVRQEG